MINMTSAPSPKHCTIFLKKMFAVGISHTVALKADGTVVAVGDNEYGQCTVSGWTDVVAITAGPFHTVGLKVDGTVVAVGNNRFKQCNVNGWKLFDNTDPIAQEIKKAFWEITEEAAPCAAEEETRRKAVEEEAKRQAAEAARAQRRTELGSELSSVKTELANTKGLFSGGKKRKLQERIAEVEQELQKL